MAGVGVLVHFAALFPLDRLVGILGLAVCAAVFARYQVKLPGRAYPTLGTVFVALSYVQFGMAAATLIQTVEALATPSDPPLALRRLFNFGQLQVSLLVLHLTVSNLVHGPADTSAANLALLLGSALYYAAILIFVSVMGSLSEGRSIAEVVPEKMEESYRSILVALAIMPPLLYTLQRGGWPTMLISAGALRASGYAVNLFLEQRRVHLDTLQKLSDLLARKTGAAENHATRVANLARLIAEAIGLPEDEVQTIFAAGTLHDIGEAEVDSRVVSIMARHAIATLADIEAYKEHAVLGEKLVAAMAGLAPVAKLIRQHHETWDGSGYPDGLKGTAIPIGARVLAAAEIVESMEDDDPHARLVRLSEVRGSLVDPDLVPAVQAALAQWDRPGRKAEGIVAGADAAMLQGKLVQAVRSSQVLETLGVSRVLSYEEGRFTNFRDEPVAVPVRDQVAPLAERCLQDQLPVSSVVISNVVISNVVTSNETAFYVYCIPAGDRSCSVLMFDVSQALAVEREHSRQIFQAYREVIAAATHGALMLLDAPAREDLMRQGELWGEMMLTQVSDCARSRELIDRLGAQYGVPAPELFRLKVCVSEAITNVFKHAGKGTLTVRTDPQHIRVIVSDQGAGIPYDILPKAILTDGYSTQRSLGKGFTVMLKYVDRVYLHTSGEGTMLVLERALAPAEVQP
jgi:anti-sigma regulatory factor (Ser/Thr protein kinase)